MLALPPHVPTELEKCKASAQYFYEHYWRVNSNIAEMSSIDKAILDAINSGKQIRLVYGRGGSYIMIEK